MADGSLRARGEQGASPVAEDRALDVEEFEGAARRRASGDEAGPPCRRQAGQEPALLFVQ
ncbi:hypothetical protein OHU17_37545 (plasmid) [Streptomyces goshikiensis]|uniref:Uncharacterized protein n=1 Tax=Streptomyces goshikiensis TaxID=1942 RepID=A0ABZ1RXH2_9ACTN|nr:hypothetical protein [Streptomyces goshikiensis]